MSTQNQSNPADFRRQTSINPHMAQAVDYWAREFRVTPARLIATVREVGRNVGEVRRRLTK